MVTQMRNASKIFTALLMVLVLSGQVIAADGITNCDMEMHQMDMPNSGMGTDKMDCCDSACAMDCSLAMVSALFENISFEATHTSSARITLPQDMALLKSYSSLYHPPITA